MNQSDNSAIPENLDENPTFPQVVTDTAMKIWLIFTDAHIWSVTAIQ